MDTAYLEFLVQKLQVWGQTFEPGLSDSEVATIVNEYGFRFPPDLRQFLQYALPVSRSWLNWRHDPPEVIQESLDWPLEGICFDIEHSNFWLDTWGPKPELLEDAFAVARELVAKAPRLIPICSHRYIPDDPPIAGNPIFSVHQTDIIQYGNDLASYFANEFKVDPTKLPEYYLPTPDWAVKSPCPIRFWDDFL